MKTEHTPLTDAELDELLRVKAGYGSRVEVLARDLREARRLLRAADHLLYTADHMWNDGDYEDRGEIGCYLAACERANDDA